MTKRDGPATIQVRVGGLSSAERSLVILDQAEPEGKLSHTCQLHKSIIFPFCFSQFGLVFLLLANQSILKDPASSFPQH